jgi:hypothetical protein
VTGLLVFQLIVLAAGVGVLIYAAVSLIRSWMKRGKSSG